MPRCALSARAAGAPAGATAVPALGLAISVLCVRKNRILIERLPDPAARGFTPISTRSKFVAPIICHRLIISLLINSTTFPKMALPRRDTADPAVRDPEIHTNGGETASATPHALAAIPAPSRPAHKRKRRHVQGIRIAGRPGSQADHLHPAVRERVGLYRRGRSQLRRGDRR
ncbi:exported hypothetical protein [Cupriavidus taiwanensis]|uniref:Uncharacterized protein n=1 Tax=Cupriavidus taiwanensis TaxID=164546 RepID=A0A976ANK3_9BURK|nr:exported hypothetical protein [Cupriavidus taiwanensis]SOY98329.1 exported hypothetical protein [Cupriavidus taiwanensis]SPA30835.1 exported hypothetical protein [Cupriavidus taiwanensis]SPD67657.1 protein of unknown function [Cupriavidus taiwanensis]